LQGDKSLHGPVDMILLLYMGIPEGMNLDPKKYIFSILGLKQAPRI
jgi:hypothetical protein